MKALKIFTIIISIVLFSTTAHAKFYYNFGLNLGIGALGWNNYDEGYAVAVVPYAPVVATPVYTPLPYSYVSYYDYGNCGWWPNVSLSLNLGGGGYCGGYYGNYYGGYGYDSYYSPFNVSIGWGNYYPNWGNSCGYYGSYGYGYNRYRYGYGYGGYGYGCNNYYINNYYYNNYPATAQRPATVRENNIPYQNQRESRNSLRSSLADNGRHNRLESSGSKTRIARSERKRIVDSSSRSLRIADAGRISSSRNLRSEIFTGRNSLPNYRSTRERVSRTPLTRTSRVSQPTRQRTTSKISQPTRQRTATRISQPTRQRSTSRVSQPTRQRTPTRISQPARQRTPTRISQPTRQRTPTRISQPTRQVSPSRISRPSAPRVSAPRVSSRAPSSARTTSMAMPVQSGGRMRR